MLLVAANSASICYASIPLLCVKTISKYLIELMNCNALKFLITYAAAEHHLYSNSMNNANVSAHLPIYWKHVIGIT